jgi:hypothetical protein
MTTTFPRCRRAGELLFPCRTFPPSPCWRAGIPMPDLAPLAIVSNGIDLKVEMWLPVPLEFTASAVYSRPVALQNGQDTAEAVNSNEELSLTPIFA